EGALRTAVEIPEGTVIPAFGESGRGGGAPTPAEVVGMLDPTLTWRDVEQLAEASSVPVLVKGILTAEDARLAVDHGAAGVIVSNHGGRQLDGVPASLEALPEVVEAVGDQPAVRVDRGLRRRADVVEGVALRAR